MTTQKESCARQEKTIKDFGDILLSESKIGQFDDRIRAFANRDFKKGEAVIKNKDWIRSIFDKATKQLEDSYACFITKGLIINKLWVALDLDLSYRLLCDPFSYDNGNIAEIAEKALYETCEPYKTAFAKNNLDISLLLINSSPLLNLENLMF